MGAPENILQLHCHYVTKVSEFGWGEDIGGEVVIPMGACVARRF